MIVFLKRILLICALAAVSASAAAETVKVPVGQQGEALQGIKIPKRGILMKVVVAEFGEPLAKSTPVGDPPISYWEYKDYFVYFERNRVLDTVLKFKQQNGAQ
jgi:hypothetical protein